MPKGKYQTRKSRKRENPERPLPLFSQSFNRAAAALNHDYVVPIYQVGEDNGVLIVPMP